MTTPDGGPAPDGAQARVKRPVPQRTGPVRSGAADQPPPQISIPASPLRDPEEFKIDEAVAASVKTAYDVLSETIEQGRHAGQRFRQGGYNYRDIPVDVRQLAGQMLKLARQLSESTFEICEALLSQQMPGFPVPPAAPGKAPPFRSPAEADPPGFKEGPAQHAAPDPHHEGMRLAVRFAGTANGAALSSSLSRPRTPTSPRDLTAAPLVSRDGAASLGAVKFDADLANGGLIATVTVPEGQPAGVYSGAVFAPGQDVPLGLLVVQLRDPAQQSGG